MCPRFSFNPSALSLSACTALNRVSVQGGRYESTNSGRYFVDKRPGVVLPPLTAAQVANPAQHGLATRHYVVSQYVRHPNLSSIQYSNFFNLVPNQSHDPCPLPCR